MAAPLIQAGGSLAGKDFWRTKTGLEVDFILGDGDVAVEVKGTSRVDARELRAIKAFMEEHAPRSAFVVCDEPSARRVDGVTLIPWREFLTQHGRVKSCGRVVILPPGACPA